MKSQYAGIGRKSPGRECSVFDVSCQAAVGSTTMGAMSEQASKDAKQCHGSILVLPGYQLQPNLIKKAKDLIALVVVEQLLVGAGIYHQVGPEFVLGNNCTSSFPSLQLWRR